MTLNLPCPTYPNNSITPLHSCLSETSRVLESPWDICKILSMSTVDNGAPSMWLMRERGDMLIKWQSVVVRIGGRVGDVYINLVEWPEVLALSA